MTDLESSLRLLRGVTGHQGYRSVALTGEGQALELVTVDADGYPRVSWLGPAEVVVCSLDSIGLALWTSSTAVRNLLRTRSGLLQFVADGAKIGVRLTVDYCCEINVGETRMSVFLAAALTSSSDSAPYADIVAGPIFRLTDGRDRLAHWERQLDLLTDAMGKREDGRR